MDTNNKSDNPVYSRNDSAAVNLTDEEWKKILPKNVYTIARQKGTERPYSKSPGRKPGNWDLLLRSLRQPAF